MMFPSVLVAATAIKDPRAENLPSCISSFSDTLLSKDLVSYAPLCISIRLAVFWDSVPKSPLIWSSSCEDVNGFLITSSIGVDGKTASNSGLFNSNMVISMTFISGRKSFIFLTSWKPVNAGILTSDTKTWQYLQSFWIWCNAISGSAKAWTVKPACSKLLPVTVKVSILSSTISIVVFSLFRFTNRSCNFVGVMVWHTSI